MFSKIEITFDSNFHREDLDDINKPEHTDEKIEFYCPQSSRA